MKGRTKWFPRHVAPVRNGLYEVTIRLCAGAYARYMGEWDGVGFLLPYMQVVRWRGQTKSAALKGGN